MKSLWDEKLYSLKQELASINNQAITVTGEVESLMREMESLKPDIVTKCLEDQRRILAQRRGFHRLLRHKEAMQAGLAIGIGSAVLGGLLSKDPISALNAGISGFDGLIQGLGETRWYVSLTNKIVVAPQDRINPQVNWVTWESIAVALENLKRKARGGERLGDFDSVLTKLREEKFVYLRL